MEDITPELAGRVLGFDERIVWKDEAGGGEFCDIHGGILQ